MFGWVMRKIQRIVAELRKSERHVSVLWGGWACVWGWGGSCLLLRESKQNWVHHFMVHYFSPSNSSLEFRGETFLFSKAKSLGKDHHAPSPTPLHIL